MTRMSTILGVAVAAVSLAGVDGAALAQGKGKGQEQKEQKEQKEQGGKPHKAKKAKHENGKNLVGEKVKKDGRHKFHDHGKHAAFVDVKGGKIVGVKVKHAEKGDVPVTKYKTKQKMAAAPAGIQPVSLILTQGGAEYLGTTWIGYAYIDDWGDEVIYWFPYDMIYDGDTGAIEYVPVY